MADRSTAFLAPHRDALDDEADGRPTGKLYRWDVAVAEQERLALAPACMGESKLDELQDIIHFQAASERLAAFLVVVSRNNGYEGRDPAVVADDLTCGMVAGMLGIGIDTMARVLIDMQRRGLVAPADGGLRLRDIDALDRLSEGA